MILLSETLSHLPVPQVNLLPHDTPRYMNHTTTICLTLSSCSDSERSSESFDSYRQLINTSLPPRIKPQHQAFMDVPKCSGCLGGAVEV